MEGGEERRGATTLESRQVKVHEKQRDGQMDGWTDGRIDSERCRFPNCICEAQSYRSFSMRLEKVRTGNSILSFERKKKTIFAQGNRGTKLYFSPCVLIKNCPM